MSDGAVWFVAIACLIAGALIGAGLYAWSVSFNENGDDPGQKR